MDTFGQSRSKKSAKYESEFSKMSSRDEFQLVLLPGLACDQRLFAEQRSHFAKAVVPEWPLFDASIGDIQSYAATCLDTWTASQALNLDHPYILAGTSFGGLMALELAWLAASRGASPAAVLLISSCRQWQAVPRWYGRWSLWATKLPQWFARRHFARRHFTIPREVASAVGAASDSKSASSLLVEAMLQSTDWNQLVVFARWMSTWRREALDLTKAPFPVHQLHGRLDSILPKPSPAHATLLLDAGHWMCATHPSSVNNWIEAVMQDIWLRKRGPKPVSK